jgi:hypothetical protein
MAGGSPLTGADPARVRRGLAVERTSDGSVVTGWAHGLVELDVGPDDGDAVRVGVLSTGRWPSWCGGAWPSCSTVTARSSGPGPEGSWPATPGPA